MDRVPMDGTEDNSDKNDSGKEAMNDEKVTEEDGSNSSPCSVDNSRTVINKIANLYAERLMSDVCLVVGNVSLMRYLI